MSLKLTEREAERGVFASPTALLQQVVRVPLPFFPLRTKALVFLGLTVLGLLVALYIPLRLIILRSFFDLEAQATRTEVERAHDALRTALGKIDSDTADYATWDNTYAFVQDHNMRFFDIDVADRAFMAQDINVVLVVDNNSQLVGAKAYGFQQQRSMPVPSFFYQPAILRSTLFKYTTATDSTTGIVLLPQGPMLVASYPIVKSSGKGPIRGSILMGRFLDAALIRELAESTHLQLSMYRPDDPHLPDEVRGQHVIDTITTQPLSKHTIVGITQLSDVFKQPGIILRVEQPRMIYTQGLTAVTSFVFVLIAVVAGSLIITGIGMERLVLARVTRLNAHVQAIGTSGDIALRVNAVGNDELTRLSQSINGMLTALEQAQVVRWQAESLRAQAQEEMLRAREQFSQMLVHDLKNPLTAIKGNLDLLRRTSLDASQMDMLDDAKHSTTATLAMVSQLLDIARLREGRLELRREHIKIALLLEVCAQELQHWAHRKLQSITVTTAPAFPTLFLDASLMRRVVVNLLSNAIKHTPTYTAIVLCADMDAMHVRISVSDNGPGIALAMQQRLFERFAATASTSQMQSNTGLGLAFCKLAVEAHDGTITFVSIPEQGTTFTVLLPLPMPVAAAPV